MRLARPPTPVTRALLLLIGIGFAAEMIVGGGLAGTQDAQVLYRLGAQEPRATLAGEWWRLVAAIFLHGGPLHLLVNGFSLLALGRLLEPVLGPRRFLVLFVVSGLVAGLATLALVRDTISVGASGAVFGLAGLLLADELTQRRLYRNAEIEGRPRWRPRMSIIPTLILNAGLAVVVPVINWQSHAGGLVAGFLLGTYWIERNLRRRGRARLALTGLAALALALGAYGMRPLPPEEAALDASALAQRAYILLRQGRPDEALADIDRALALEPDNAGYRFLRAGVHQARGDMRAAFADARAACDGGLAQACRDLERAKGAGP